MITIGEDDRPFQNQLTSKFHGPGTKSLVWPQLFTSKILLTRLWFRLARRLGEKNSGFVNFDQAEAEYSANLGRLDVKNLLANARKSRLTAGSHRTGAQPMFRKS